MVAIVLGQCALLRPHCMAETESIEEGRSQQGRSVRIESPGLITLFSASQSKESASHPDSIALKHITANKVRLFNGAAIDQNVFREVRFLFDSLASCDFRTTFSVLNFLREECEEVSGNKAPAAGRALNILRIVSGDPSVYVDGVSFDKNLSTILGDHAREFLSAFEQAGLGTKELTILISRYIGSPCQIEFVKCSEDYWADNLSGRVMSTQQLQGHLDRIRGEPPEDLKTGQDRGFQGSRNYSANNNRSFLVYMLAFAGPLSAAASTGLPEGLSDDEGSGACGPIGEPGPPGRDGLFGPRGYAGRKGDPGPKGDSGREPGPQGSKGDSGLKGDSGFNGEAGSQGPQGGSGPQGPRGNSEFKGEAGPQGRTGSKGDTGDPGSQGPSNSHWAFLGGVAGSLLVVGSVTVGLGIYRAYRRHRDLAESWSCSLVRKGFADIFSTDYRRMEQAGQASVSPQGKTEMVETTFTLELRGYHVVCFSKELACQIF